MFSRLAARRSGCIWRAGPDRTRGRRLRRRLARGVASVSAVGVLGFAALGASLAGATTLAPPATSHLGSTSVAPALPGMTKVSQACENLQRSHLSRLFTVRVGAPYYEGSGACVYGIGPNAKLTGPAVVTTESDTFLAQLFPGLGASQYKYYTTALGKTNAFRAPGYKASYQAQVDFGQMEGFNVYVLKGSLFCLVDINLSSSHEVGLGPVTSSLPAGEAVGLAKRVIPLCADMFASS